MRVGWLLGVSVAGAVAAAQAASANVLVRVDKSTQQMSVWVDGALRWQWRVSTGRPGRDTPSGTFRAFRLDADHRSKEFDNAPMPYSIFFTKGGDAIHGYFDIPHLGQPVSHGCVRLDPANAAKLYAVVQQEGVTNTTVQVTGNVMAALGRRRGLGVSPGEMHAAPVALAPPAPEVATDSFRSYSRPYRSTDERFAQPVYRQEPPVYRQDNDGYGYSRYREPPSPPPGYPSFPRAGFFVDGGR